MNKTSLVCRPRQFVLLAHRLWLTLSQRMAALFPAIQIHRIESILSAAPLSRIFGSHKLQPCMIVLSELRDNYWGAKAPYRPFEQAEARLHNRPGHHRANSIASDYSSSDNLGNQFTSVPFLIPGGQAL